MRFQRVQLALLLSFATIIAAEARGAGPADELFRLLPPDAGVTLAIEDLRSHVRAFQASSLADGLFRLPAVRAWLASPKFQDFERARSGIESALGDKIANIRDELFGDAIVLTLHVPHNAGFDQARGLLITRVRSRALLDRVIKTLNDSQKQTEGLKQLAERTWHGATYTVREFREGTRPPEYYTILEERTVAWSNSEELIRGVIDRKAGGAACLSENPKFQTLRRRLPAGAFASLFVDPRFVERAVGTLPPPAKPGEEQVQALLGRYISAVEYAGIALVPRDGFVLHTQEILNPAKLDPWIKKWAAQTKKIDPTLLRVPTTALAVATISVDLGAISDGIDQVVPESARAKVANLRDLLRGVMLGRDLGTAVLPNVGPGILAYFDAPTETDSKQGLPVVLAIQVGDSGVAAALENALRTFLTFYALDDKREQGRLRVIARETNGTKVISLDSSTPFAFALDRGRLVIAPMAEAVVRSLSSEADARLQQFREKHFPQVESFAWLDLVSIHKYATSHRGQLVKHLAAANHGPEAAEADDLEHVLALIDLFQAAYLTTEMAPDATSIHRSLGLIAKPASPAK